MTLTRIGQCPATGCGKCCEFLELEVHPFYQQDDDTRKWVTLHGITLSTREQRVYARIPVPCSALTADKRCGVYGTEARPELCSAWPNMPADIKEPSIEPWCTLEFVEAAGAPV